MIIIELNYTAPLYTIEMHLEDHKNFLKKYYKNKVFLASGHKEPRTGGVIIANGSQKEIKLIIEEDPFKKTRVGKLFPHRVHPQYVLR